MQCNIDQDIFNNSASCDIKTYRKFSCIYSFQMLISKHLVSTFYDVISDNITVIYTLSGRIGKLGGCIVCWSCKVDSRLSCGCTADLYYICTRSSGGTAHGGEKCDQSIGSAVSDAIVRSWLWSISTRSSPLGYFGKLLQVVENLPHMLW